MVAAAAAVVAPAAAVVAPAAAVVAPAAAVVAGVEVVVGLANGRMVRQLKTRRKPKGHGRQVQVLPAP